MFSFCVHVAQQIADEKKNQEKIENYHVRVHSQTENTRAQKHRFHAGQSRKRTKRIKAITAITVQQPKTPINSVLKKF